MNSAKLEDSVGRAFGRSRHGNEEPLGRAEGRDPGRQCSEAAGDQSLGKNGILIRGQLALTLCINSLHFRVVSIAHGILSRSVSPQARMAFAKSSAT